MTTATKERPVPQSMSEVGKTRPKAKKYRVMYVPKLTDDTLPCSLSVRDGDTNETWKAWCQPRQWQEVPWPLYAKVCTLIGRDLKGTALNDVHEVETGGQLNRMMEQLIPAVPKKVTNQYCEWLAEEIP
jgi:hypothetical protein